MARVARKEVALVVLLTEFSSLPHCNITTAWQRRRVHFDIFKKHGREKVGAAFIARAIRSGYRVGGAVRHEGYITADSPEQLPQGAVWQFWLNSGAILFDGFYGSYSK
jgi:hypothetical protein